MKTNCYGMDVLLLLCLISYIAYAERGLVFDLSMNKQVYEPTQIVMPRLPLYYGRILYEDGSVPETDARFGVYVGGPFSRPDQAGYFMLFIPPSAMEFMKSRNQDYPIFDGFRPLEPIGQFPLNLLSQEKVHAGTVKIPRPEVQ